MLIFQANLFDVISLILLAYMMLILVLYWRVDFLLWRDGPAFVAEDILKRLTDINSLLGTVENIEKRMRREEGAEVHQTYQ